MSVISVCMCLRTITNRKTGKSASAACLFGAKQLRCLLDTSVTSLCLHFHKEVNLSCSTATTAALRSRCAESPLEAVPNVTAKKRSSSRASTVLSAAALIACRHCTTLDALLYLTGKFDMHLALHLLRFSFASALNITVCDGCVRDTVIKAARVQKKDVCEKDCV